MSIAQLKYTNLPMLLHWEDRNSMAHSIEARVPFLDHRVVELCLSIRSEDKVGGGISKQVLRSAMRGIVPDAVLNRQDKMGFVTAEPLWMSRDASEQFRLMLREAVDRLNRYVSPEIIDQYDEVSQGKRPFDFRFWRVISAGLWAKKLSVNT